MKEYKLYINGEWKDSSSGKRFNSVDPSTEEEWASFPEANESTESTKYAYAFLSLDINPPTKGSI